MLNYAVLAVDPHRICRLRLAHDSDLERLAALRVGAWHSAYRGILPQAELGRVDLTSSLRALARNRHGRDRALLLAEDLTGGEPLGYALLGPQLDARLPAYRGEIYELYVATDHRGRGIGRCLLAGALWKLVERGLHPSVVWVLTQNPARYFYASCGGELVAHDLIHFGDYRGYRFAFSWTRSLPLPPPR